MNAAFWRNFARPVAPAPVVHSGLPDRAQSPMAPYPAAPAQIGISLRDLTLRFDQQLIFDQFCLEIEAGALVALLGTSGAGKTCLLKMIAGLLQPDAGSIIGSDGLPLSQRIAYMGQRDLLYPWLTVMENITLSARLQRKSIDRLWANELLERVGLRGYQHALPATLSGGMRQRVALARTLYQRQPVVLMDEPFSALDTLTRAKVHTLAAQVLADHTVVLITHDPQEACRLSHRIVILSGQPTTVTRELRPGGAPPRAPDDPHLLQAQGRILSQWLQEAQ